MGTLTNGIKEIFATAKTTGTNVMMCGNDGTPDGHITMSNLASVLGVLRESGNIAANTDLDTISTNSIFSIVATVVNGPVATKMYGTLFNITNTSGYYKSVQIIIMTTGTIYTRIRTSVTGGGAWHTINPSS